MAGLGRVGQGAPWPGAVGSGTVRPGEVRPGPAWSGLAWPGEARCGVAQTPTVRRLRRVRGRSTNDQTVAADRALLVGASADSPGYVPHDDTMSRVLQHRRGLHVPRCGSACGGARADLRAARHPVFLARISNGRGASRCGAPSTIPGSRGIPNSFASPSNTPSSIALRIVTSSMVSMRQTNNFERDVLAILANFFASRITGGGAVRLIFSTPWPCGSGRRPTGCEANMVSSLKINIRMNIHESARDSQF